MEAKGLEFLHLGRRNVLGCGQRVHSVDFLPAHLTKSSWEHTLRPLPLAGTKGHPPARAGGRPRPRAVPGDVPGGCFHFPPFVIIHLWCVIRVCFLFQCQAPFCSRPFPGPGPAPFRCLRPSVTASGRKDCFVHLICFCVFVLSALHPSHSPKRHSVCGGSGVETLGRRNLGDQTRLPSLRGHHEQHCARGVRSDADPPEGVSQLGTRPRYPETSMRVLPQGPNRGPFGHHVMTAMGNTVKTQQHLSWTRNGLLSVQYCPGGRSNLTQWKQLGQNHVHRVLRHTETQRHSVILVPEAQHSGPVRRKHQTNPHCGTRLQGSGLQPSKVCKARQELLQTR